jgi:hypothetical protein
MDGLDDFLPSAGDVADSGVFAWGGIAAALLLLVYSLWSIQQQQVRAMEDWTGNKRSAQRNQENVPARSAKDQSAKDQSAKKKD